jgi:hypothetical protein
MNKLPNSLSPRVAEKLLWYLCFINILIIGVMGLLGILGKEDSLVFASFDRLAFAVIGGILGAIKFQSHE